MTQRYNISPIVDISEATSKQSANQMIITYVMIACCFAHILASVMSRPPTTWIHQICRDTGVTATEALQLAEDRPFWRTIATAGGFG